ncbi:MAG: hypothetical protein ACKO2C_02255 [Actinomycetes bacterium]
MNFRSRILGASATLALAVGMTAAPAFAGSPVSTNPYAPFSDTSMEDYGVCGGFNIGAIANSTKTGGMNLNEQALSNSIKGYPVLTSNLAKVGECTMDSKLGSTNVGSPLATTVGSSDITRDVAKFGTKLTTVAGDCNNSAGDQNDPDERAFHGKMSWTFANGIDKTDAYIRVQGFDSTPVLGAELVWVVGTVTKGDATGSTVYGQVWFNPLRKLSKVSLSLTAFPSGGPDTDAGVSGLQQTLRPNNDLVLTSTPVLYKNDLGAATFSIPVILPDNYLDADPATPSTWTADADSDPDVFPGADGLVGDKVVGTDDDPTTAGVQDYDADNNTWNVKVAAPGYVGNHAIGIASAAGCALGVGFADITTIGVGAGTFGGGSLIFNQTTAGIHFLL